MAKRFRVEFDRVTFFMVEFFKMYFFGLEFEQPEFYFTLKNIQMRTQCCLNFNIKYSMPFKILNIMALICLHNNGTET